MTTAQKILLALGIGGLATFLLWRLWPSRGSSPVLPPPEEPNVYPDLGYSPDGDQPLGTAPGDPQPMMGRAPATLRSAAPQCPMNTYWDSGLQQCMPIE